MAGGGGSGSGGGGGGGEAVANPELKGEDASRGTFVASIGFFIGEGGGKGTNGIVDVYERGRGGGWVVHDILEQVLSGSRRHSGAANPECDGRSGGGGPPPLLDSFSMFEGKPIADVITGKERGGQGVDDGLI